jgi:hypothetical protein
LALRNSPALTVGIADGIGVGFTGGIADGIGEEPMTQASLLVRIP